MSSQDHCIFCKIIDKKIPASIVGENETTIIFKDLHPQAEIHFLAIPKKHCTDVIDAPDAVRESVFSFIKEWTKENGLAKKGFRLVINTGAGGGQTVFHFHVHILSGQLTDRFG